MALFDFIKKKHHYVQSYENPEDNGIRIYFNGEDEKKSNQNMLGYIGEDEYKKIKLEPEKYKYKKEEMTESQLKSMGINSNTTGHFIYTGSTEIKNEIKNLINVQHEIQELTTENIKKIKTGPKVYEETKSQDHGIKVDTKNNEKEININVSDDHGNKSKAKGFISNSGKEIHIHINLGSSPHIEKAMIENQEAIKKLQQEYAQSLQEAKDTIKIMEEKLKDKNLEKNTLSSNFSELTNKKIISKAESAFHKETIKQENNSFNNVIEMKKEVKTNHTQEPSNEIDKETTKSEIIHTENKAEIKLNEVDIEEKKEENELNKEAKEVTSAIAFKEALNLAKKENAIFFRGRYQKKDSIEGLSYDHIDNTAKQILKEKYDVNGTSSAY